MEKGRIWSRKLPVIVFVFIIKYIFVYVFRLISVLHKIAVGFIVGFFGVGF